MPAFLCVVSSYWFFDWTFLNSRPSLLLHPNHNEKIRTTHPSKAKSSVVSLVSPDNTNISASQIGKNIIPHSTIAKKASQKIIIIHAIIGDIFSWIKAATPK